MVYMMFPFKVHNESTLNPSHHISSPLQIACLNKNVSHKELKYLIEKKSEINHQDKDGHIALHKLCENEIVSLDLVKLMVESKSDLNHINNKNYNPLYLACENPNIHLDVIKYLIEKKSNPNIGYGFQDSIRAANNNINLLHQITEKYNKSVKEFFESFY